MKMVCWGAILMAIAVTVAALPADVPEMPEIPPLLEPRHLALELNDEEFEDYLDRWFEEQYALRNVRIDSSRSGCQFRVNGDLGQPQPVYIHNNGFIQPEGTNGIIRISTGDNITISCPGTNRQIAHPQISSSVSTGTVNCVSGSLVSGSWLNGSGEFGGLTCNSHATQTAEETSERCYNDFPVIRVGFWVENVFHPLFYSCFDPTKLEVLYAWYEQNPSNAVHQINVDRPSWSAGSFFPGVSINNLYTQATQKATIAGIVGEELASKYITSSQYLARGHLAAKTDMIFATGQRATFYFINCAPQWQPFNGGNWNTLEQNLRTRVGAAGYYTTVWTGTFGVTQLRNQQDQLVDIYLLDNSKISVPLYYYKVVYDADRRQGTAFVGINNPHYNSTEVQQLQFCTDRCRNNSAFNWLNWQPDRIDLGYSFCCTIDEFRKYIPHLPSFVTNGLLT